MKAALVGIGYWGRNYLRLLSQRDDVELKYVGDTSSVALSKITVPFETIKTNQIDRIYNDKEIDFVVVTTPASTHYDVVKNLLLSGKSVLVEKPLTLNHKEAEELVSLANANGLILLTGHTFLYNDAFKYVKEFVNKGGVGRLLYIYGERMGLGPIRADASCLWDLAVHDVAMVIDLMNSVPSNYSLTTSNFINRHKNISDFANFSLKYMNNLVFSFNVTWYFPSKVRKWNIIGSNAMITFDDTIKDYPVTIKNISVNDSNPESGYEGYYSEGDLFEPHIIQKEPLSNLLEEFILKIKNKEKFQDKLSIDVVTLLEKMENGEKIEPN